MFRQHLLFILYLLHGYFCHYLSPDPPVAGLERNLHLSRLSPPNAMPPPRIVPMFSDSAYDYDSPLAKLVNFAKSIRPVRQANDVDNQVLDRIPVENAGQVSRPNTRSRSKTTTTPPPPNADSAGDDAEADSNESGPNVSTDVTTFRPVDDNQRTRGDIAPGSRGQDPAPDRDREEVEEFGPNHGSPTTTSESPIPSQGLPVSNLSTGLVNYYVAAGEEIEVFSESDGKIIDLFVFGPPPESSDIANDLVSCLDKSRTQELTTQDKTSI